MNNYIFPVDAFKNTCDDEYFNLAEKILVLCAIMVLSFVEMIILALAALSYLCGDMVDIANEMVKNADFPGKAEKAKEYMENMWEELKAWGLKSWSFRSDIIAIDRCLEDWEV